MRNKSFINYKFVSKKIFFGLLFMISYHSVYAQGLTVNLNPPGVMSRGSSYTVPIRVTNFNNVNVFQFELLFNKDNLQLANEPSASYLGISISTNTVDHANTNGIVIIMWISPSSTLNFGNGELLTIRFNVRPNARIGIDSIKFLRTQCIVADFYGTSLNPQYYDSNINILTDVKDHRFPSGFTLNQNYPNPFNPNTTISYQLPQESFVELKIFDLIGNEVALLVKEKQQVGNYRIPFDARNKLLSSGVYFYTLDAGVFHQVRKMILLK